LFIRQINSARNMQLIQPKMKELQDKYGADREKLGIETQKLMKAEGVNPAASCFPMLLQMPVFFALYQVLYAAASNVPRGYFFVKNPQLVESLNSAQFLGARLSGRFWLDDWSQFGATQIMALILVLMMTGLLFVTQKQLMGKNMPPEALKGPMAQQQKMMLYMFPVMYLFMGAWIPVGVLVYWVTNSIWTLAQQWLLIHNNPTPGTPAYIEWEERMIRQGKDPKAIAEARRAKRVRTPNTSTSRTVGTSGTGGTGVARPVKPGDGTSGTNGTNGSGVDGFTGNIGPGESGIQRQQIQRQQPSRQARSTRKKTK